MTLSSLPGGFPDTVRSLHRVAAEQVASAREPDEITLEATPGGFGTPELEFEGARRRVRVEGVDLVREADGEQERTPLEVDPEGAKALAEWYAFAADVLGQLVSLASDTEAATQPTLWPEHFDLAVELGSERLGTRATYGFSPGDENHPEPYVYVAPWSAPVSGRLWHAHGFRGAELGYAELLAAADQRRAALDFLVPRWDLMTIMAAGRE